MNTLDKYMKEQSVSNQSMKDSGIEWIGKIPIDWNIKKLKRCIIEINEKNNPVKMTNVLSLTKDKGVIPYENKGNQGNKSKEDLTQYKIAYKDTIIANSMNVIIGSVGISNYNGCVSPAYYVFKSNVENDLRFINYIFQTESFQKQLRRYANGILEIRLRISFENLLSQQIPTPSLNEQRKIADFLDNEIESIDKLITNTQNLIEEYESYKTALITQTVTCGLNPDVEMKDSGFGYLGVIPSHWDVVPLKYLGSCINGISKGAKYFGSGFAFVSYSDVYKNYELPSAVCGLVESSQKERDTYSVEYGDVFFTRTSETKEEVAFSSTCLSSIDNATFAGFLIRFRPYNMNRLLPEFSKYYFRSNIHRNYFIKEMNLVTRVSLSQELLKKLLVLLPPLSEQKKIVEYLDSKINSIDNIISNKENLISELEDYKKSLIFEYTTGKKRV